MKTIAISGGFDNLRSRHVRFLEEASKCGRVHVALWGDHAINALEGKPPRLPEGERLYLLQSLRFVDRVTLVKDISNPDTLPEFAGVRPEVWIADEESDMPGKQAHAESRGIDYRVIGNEALGGFAIPPFVLPGADSERKRVIVTGCYDWFHSGHVRFFEEVSALGNVSVVVGHDANIRLLKGGGHPLQSHQERLYMVHSVRYVHQAMVSSGHGWMDAEPEIDIIKPHVYVVNEDGDKPEKRDFCDARGIEYVVLKRVPKKGLPRRESTELRGF